MATKTNFVAVTGLDAGSLPLKNVGAPVAATDAATRGFASDAANLTAGTMPAARLPALTGGDVTSPAGSAVLTLANSGVTAGTYNNSATQNIPLVVDAKGRVTGIGAAVTITPAWASITSKPTTLTGFGITDAVSSASLGIAGGVATLDGTGKVAAAQLPASVTGGMSYQGTWNATTNTPTIPAAGTGNKGWYYKVATAGGTAIDGETDWKVGDWIVSNGTSWDKIDNTDSVSTVNGQTGAVVISTITGNAGTASALQTARSIALGGDATGSASFDGSANITISATLANSGVTAGTYAASATQNVPFTVDAKGRVTAFGAPVTITPDWANITGKPTTLAGYSISDAQPLDADLTAIAALAGATGLLRKTALNTWSLDTAAYLTGNQSITVSGDATGSGTTAIALTLANSGVTAGTYNNSATQNIPLVVDAKGRVTGIGAAVTITPAWGSVTGKPTTVSGFGITDALTTADNAQIRLQNADSTSGALTTSTTAANQVALSLPAATYRVVEYLISVTSGSSHQAHKVLCVHNGTTVTMTEYGTVTTGAILATFDVDISAGNLRLLVTPVNAVTTIKVMADGIDV